MPNPLIGKIFDEFPEESDWDVVVIGAGPNGLIASAYLAKAGLKVATVERRYEIGGGLATEEILFPGYYSNMHSVYHMMVDYMPALQDFNMDRIPYFNRTQHFHVIDSEPSNRRITGKPSGSD